MLTLMVNSRYAQIVHMLLAIHFHICPNRLVAPPNPNTTLAAILAERSIS